MVDGQGQRTTGRCRLNGYSISSLCEPNGSGELKMCYFLNFAFIYFIEKIWAAGKGGYCGHFSQQPTSLDESKLFDFDFALVH